MGFMYVCYLGRLGQDRDARYGSFPGSSLFLSLLVKLTKFARFLGRDFVIYFPQQPPPCQGFAHHNARSSRRSLKIRASLVRARETYIAVLDHGMGTSRKGVKCIYIQL